MDKLSEILLGQQPQDFQTTLARSGGSLQKAEITQLDAMILGMISYYPHQEFPEETLKQYRAEFRLMVTQHGIPLLRDAMLATRRQPSRRFFPHPSEVAEVLEEMASKAKVEAAKALPQLGCDACREGGWDLGWVIEQQPGQPRIVKPCACRSRREQAKKAMA